MPEECALLTPEILASGSRNISLDAQGTLKGAGDAGAALGLLAGMVGRFRAQAL